MVGDAAAFCIYAGLLFGIFAAIAYVSDHYAEDEDEDLLWVDRQIEMIRNRPASQTDDDPDMIEQRRQQLERLYRVRRRLVGEA